MCYREIEIESFIVKVSKETRTLRRIEKSISHILSLHIKVGYCNMVLDCFHYYVHYVLYVDMMVK